MCTVTLSVSLPGASGGVWVRMTQHSTSYSVQRSQRSACHDSNSTINGAIAAKVGVVCIRHAIVSGNFMVPVLVSRLIFIFLGGTPQRGYGSIWVVFIICRT